jgi:hypothetical protein
MRPEWLPLGTPNAGGSCAAFNGAQRDLCEWENALLGAAEQSGGLKVGAMIGDTVYDGAVWTVAKAKSLFGSAKERFAAMTGASVTVH